MKNAELKAGADLEADHPGFHDPIYRDRRKMIADIAIHYKGGPVPKVDYSKEEIGTWGVALGELNRLFPKSACKEYLKVFQELNFQPDAIPQLEDVSNFVRERTGFWLRPVTGLLSPRQFLNGLAFKCFHSTQYIRHHSLPLYTPEPDIVHELVGHVPLLADPDFAAMTEEIGLASLGATEEEVLQLSTVYWFSVEFGLLKEADGLKAYGAGVLSSFGELENALSDAAVKRPFDPPVTALQEYPITTYQPVYFVAESFAQAKEQLRAYTSTLSTAKGRKKVL